MERYNNQRTNQGKRCQGRTPKQTWDDGYEMYKKYVLDLEASAGSGAEDGPIESDGVVPASPGEDRGAKFEVTEQEVIH